MHACACVLVCVGVWCACVHVHPGKSNLKQKAFPAGVLPFVKHFSHNINGQ